MIYLGHFKSTPFPTARAGFFLLIFGALSGILPAHTIANSDVYRVLPADTRILQYSLADFDGDAREELAVLYTTSDETRLTVFKEDSGRWTRWWDDNGTISGKAGIAPRSLETVDTNGDGRDDIITYSLTAGNIAMAARILTLDNRDPVRPVFDVILEDMTAPPGYPILGTEGPSSSVTFLKMATVEADGYQRVYCWDGEKFEKCREVEWKNP